MEKYYSEKRKLYERSCTFRLLRFFLICFTVGNIIGSIGSMLYFDKFSWVSCVIFFVLVLLCVLCHIVYLNSLQKSFMLDVYCDDFYSEEFLKGVYGRKTFDKFLKLKYIEEHYKYVIYAYRATTLGKEFVEKRFKKPSIDKNSTE